MRDILLIIPAYNEEQSIIETVTEIRRFNRKRKRKVDFIVIDDGSTDRTAELLRLFHIPCFHMESNRGIGGAVQQGYRYAKEKNYKYAVQFDGDGQHGIEYIYDVIAPIERGEADMVIGSRFAGLDFPSDSSEDRTGDKRPDKRLPCGGSFWYGCICKCLSRQISRTRILCETSASGKAGQGSPGENA